jgi:hypothetical protein
VWARENEKEKGRKTKNKREIEVERVKINAKGAKIRKKEGCVSREFWRLWRGGKINIFVGKGETPTWHLA